MKNVELSCKKCYKGESTKKVRWHLQGQRSWEDHGWWQLIEWLTIRCHDWWEQLRKQVAMIFLRSLPLEMSPTLIFGLPIEETSRSSTLCTSSWLWRGCCMLYFSCLLGPTWCIIRGIQHSRYGWATYMSSSLASRKVWYMIMWTSSMPRRRNYYDFFLFPWYLMNYVLVKSS